ncbi:MAG: HipA domain-containing protein [Flavihumibacter sp.]|nr:HipA domain-containing protein [Flavihumibacter sp.]
MAVKKTDIIVYADWYGLSEPTRIGILSAQQAKGRKAFSFAYENRWIQTNAQRLLDPDIQWYKGPQHPIGKENFGVFMDSMPDTWGRKLMLRRAALQAAEEGKPVHVLYDIDYLLGVFDETRMGAVRFKLEPDGPFLDNNPAYPTPPWSTIRELQHAASIVDSDKESKGIKKYIAILIAPGSSLGGARPKANILDDIGNYWIAKFPSKSDMFDKAAWEFLAHKLAVQAGITMAECRIDHVAGPFRTFFTKRFDRQGKQRIHFASAMTTTGNSEDLLKDNPASYLDIALFIQTYGCNIREDLHQLWRRIIFNIAISNTDDHLRNHGFILTDAGWRLSPAYDLNPSIDKGGLQLNIDTANNALDYNLAKSVGEYFQLKNAEMDQIISEVKKVVCNWRDVAAAIDIPRNEVEIMALAFQ